MKLYGMLSIMSVLRVIFTYQWEPLIIYVDMQQNDMFHVHLCNFITSA